MQSYASLLAIVLGSNVLTTIGGILISSYLQRRQNRAEIAKIHADTRRAGAERRQLQEEILQKLYNDCPTEETKEHLWIYRLLNILAEEET